MLFNSHPPMVNFYWVEVLFNVFSPTKKLHQSDCFTFRTICWKISRFLSYFSWLQHKQFVLTSVQQNVQQKNVIPGKTKKEHQIGILLLWLFGLRAGWSGQLFPVWFCVQERNSQLRKAAGLFVRKNLQNHFWRQQAAAELMLLSLPLSCLQTEKQYKNTILWF